VIAGIFATDGIVVGKEIEVLGKKEERGAAVAAETATPADDTRFWFPKTESDESFGCLK
jgi:hypothetical protein